MPWVAALNGKVDVVYYGTSPAAADVGGVLGDANTVWNTYDTQLGGGVWDTGLVSNTPNRVGRVCLNGSGCPNNKDRELLDLFEVAEDPATGKAAVIYTETTTDTWTGSDGSNARTPRDRARLRAITRAIREACRARARPLLASLRLAQVSIRKGEPELRLNGLDLQQSDQWRLILPSNGTTSTKRKRRPPPKNSSSPTLTLSG
jgi:hypothetical protein